MSKHSEIKRDKRLIIPVTEEERERIKKAASRTVYGSTANLCRTVILSVLPTIENHDPNDNEIELVIENKETFLGM